MNASQWKLYKENRFEQVIYMSMQRINRISEQMKKEISSIIMNEIKDPRVSEMCSVISVKVTPDLKFCKGICKCFGNDEDKNKFR